MLAAGTKQKKANNRRARRVFMRVLSVALIIVSLLFSVYRFAPVFTRFYQAICDLILSLGAYGVFWAESATGQFFGSIDTTVQNIPDGMDTILPLTLEEFKLFLANFWALFKNPDNLSAWFNQVMITLGNVAEIVIRWLIPVLSVSLLVFLAYRKVQTKEDLQGKGEEDEKKTKKKAKIDRKPKKEKKPKIERKPKKKKKPKIERKPKKEKKKTKAQEHVVVEKVSVDSPALVTWKKIRKHTTLKIKKFLRAYIPFLKTKKAYCVIFALIWCYNLNLLTIAIEALAWLFYWCVLPWEFLNIFVQVAKLAVDISIPIFFLPKWLQFFVGYKIFDFFRRKSAKKRVKAKEDKNLEYVKNHKGALFIVGKQRSKKTSLMVALKRIFERHFRDKANEKLRNRDKQFPFFPWQTIEKSVEYSREKGTFVIFEDMENFAQEIFETWREKKILKYKKKRDHLREAYGFDIDDFVKYAEDGYPLVYNNDSLATTIWKAIERYAQLYFIYSQQTPLDVSNLSIREDFTFKTFGNFPIFDGDMLKSQKESKKHTQYSHIIPYDAFRPGKAFNEQTRYDVAIEYGIGCMTEVAKERKNRYSRNAQGSKDKEDLVANQDNDLFELDTKMRGHVATIDNFDFWVWLMDDQRFDALGADAKELTTKMMIKHTSEAEILYPFIAIDEALCSLADKIRDAFHYFVKNRKYQNTLLDYFSNFIHQFFFKHFDRIKNKYGVHTVTVKTQDGQDDEILGEADKLYVTVGDTYNDIFATDSCRVYYREKHRKAKISLDKREQYTSAYPTTEQYAKQDSYFDIDMGGEDRRVPYPKKQEKTETSETVTAAPAPAPEPTEAPKKRGRGRPPKSQA